MEFLYVSLADAAGRDAAAAWQAECGEFLLFAAGSDQAEHLHSVPAPERLQALLGRVGSTRRQAPGPS